MKISPVTGSLAILMLAVGTAATARAAADLEFRESRVRHVCKRGPSDGNVCCRADDCPEGQCVVDYVPKTSFGGTMTFIVDNDVTNLDGARLSGVQVKALTVMLDLGKREPLIAQTFQNLDGSSLQALIDALKTGPVDEFGFDINERTLEDELTQAGTLQEIDVSFLFFRMFDAETQRALRVAAGLPPEGPEKLTVQLDKAKPVVYADHFTPASTDPDADDTDPVATVLKVKVTLRFVALAPPECL
jgi:hypothetical protein